MTAVEKVDGIFDFNSDGDHWLIIYSGTDVLFWGKYSGQLTSPHLIEYFDTEVEMFDRFLALGLTQDEEMTERMVELGLI